jgi:GNAT superfamily N-acetyltransferase
MASPLDNAAPHFCRQLVIAMDKIALSLKLKRFIPWFDSRCEPGSQVRKQFDGAPFGSCYVTVDPGHQGSAASGNLNRVYLCGTEAGLQPAGLDHLIELFTAEGVKRFFVWLSPGPDMDRVRGWLQARGLSRGRWTGYPTLCREGHTPIEFRTDLEIRDVGKAEIEAARDQLGETLWPEYARSAGAGNFFHYMAFDGARPVAIAALCLFEDLGYLMAARTAESHRKRGAQQALIAARVKQAERLGYSILVSETLTMLEHSLRNLQRAGFQEVYEKEVYEWNA